jgi:hypothetical protein
MEIEWGCVPGISWTIVTQSVPMASLIWLLLLVSLQQSVVSQQWNRGQEKELRRILETHGIPIGGVKGSSSLDILPPKYMIELFHKETTRKDPSDSSTNTVTCIMGKERI